MDLIERQNYENFRIIYKIIMSDLIIRHYYMGRGLLFDWLSVCAVAAVGALLI